MDGIPEKGHKNFDSKYVLYLVTLIAMVAVIFFYMFFSVRNDAPGADTALQGIKNRLDRSIKFPKVQNGWYDFEKAAAKFKSFDRVFHNRKKILKHKVDILRYETDPKHYKTVEKWRSANKGLVERIKKGINKKCFYMPFSPEGTCDTICYRMFPSIESYLLTLGHYEKSKRNAGKALEYYIAPFKMRVLMGKNHGFWGMHYAIAYHRMTIGRILFIYRTEKNNTENYRFVTRELDWILRRCPPFLQLFDTEFYIFDNRFDYLTNHPSQKMDFTDRRVAYKNRQAYRNWYLKKRKSLTGIYSHDVSYLYPDKDLSYIDIPSGAVGKETCDYRALLKEYSFFLANLRGLLILSALKWYKSEKGVYPKTLSDLTPKYLKKIPKDPYTGNNFIYKTKKGKITLYAIGPDLMDSNASKTISDYNDFGDVVIIRQAD